MKGLEFKVVQTYEAGNPPQKREKETVAYIRDSDIRCVMPHPEIEDRALLLVSYGEFQLRMPYKEALVCLQNL